MADSPAPDPRVSPSTIFGDHASLVARVIAIGNVESPITLHITDNPTDVRMLQTSNPYRGLHAVLYADRLLSGGRTSEIQQAISAISPPGEQPSVFFVTSHPGDLLNRSSEKTMSV